MFQRFNYLWMVWALGASGLLLFLTDCSKYAMFMETQVYAMPAALSTGPDLNAQDLKTAFDWPSMDGFERNRFVSNLVNVVLIKTKLQAFQFIPYIPSISLMWLFTHGIGLWFFVRILRKFFPQNHEAVWLGSLFFVLSPAMMSAFINHFHPAKPIVLVCGIICFYYTIRQRERSLAGLSIAARDLRHWSILFLLFVIATFSDESGAIIALLCGAMYPDFFLFHKRGRLIAAIWTFCVIVYVLSTFILAPKLVALAGYPPFDFSAATGRYTVFTAQNVFYMYPRFLLWSIYAFVAQHSLPFYSAVVYHISILSDFTKEHATQLKSWPYPIAEIPLFVVWIMFLLPLMFLLSWAAMHYRREQELYTRLLGCVVVMSAAFVALNQMPFNGNYYYANITAIPITLWLTKLLDPKIVYTNYKLRMLRTLATCSVVVCALFNVYDTNCLWTHTSNGLSGKDIRAAWLMTPPEHHDFCAHPTTTGRQWLCNTMDLVDAGNVVRSHQEELLTIANSVGLTKSDIRYVFKKEALYHPAAFLTVLKNMQFPPACHMCVLVTPHGITDIRFRDTKLPPDFKLPHGWNVLR